MKTIRVSAIAVVVAFALSGCSSKAHDEALANAIVSAQATQAHEAALASAIEAVHAAIGQQNARQQPYNIKASASICEGNGGTPNECARQASIKAFDDRMAVLDARLDCIHLGGTHDQCNR
jgi:hypothetical protein